MAKRRKTKAVEQPTWLSMIAEKAKAPINDIMYTLMIELGFRLWPDGEWAIPATMPRFHPEGGLLSKARYENEVNE